MPESAVVNDRYQVRIVGRMEGQETNNVLHFACTGADSDVLTNLILVLAECFITHLLPVLSSSWSLESIKWKRVSPTLGQEIVSIPVGAGAGGGNAAALPSYCSAVISIRSSLGGRSHRGRMYIPGIPEAATINSSFDDTDAFWAGLVAFAACIVTNFVVGDPPGAPSWQMMIYSRKLGGANFPYGAAGFTAMKGLVPVKLLGTTRSRKVGRGS
jgi:hypothetical protein